MESFTGDTEESTEDIGGRKKSKLKSLKTRLFGRSKRTVGAREAKLSQSASDITAGKGLGSNEDLACSQGTMGSRALSHDSIFLADEVLTEAEPAKVLSQENVHSKIKTLQMKLQQQKLHLGPPPLVRPIRHPEELGCHSEDDSLLQSPVEISGGDVASQGALSKTMSPTSSSPLSPLPKPALTKSVPLPPSLPLLISNSSNSPSSVVEPPLDFSSPAEFTPCLDTSAARHRMSVKPRNQRASTKRRHTAADARSYTHTLNNVHHPEPVKEEEQQIVKVEVTLGTEQGEADTPILSQPSTKCPEVAPVTSDMAPKSSSLTSQQDNTPPGTVPSVSSEVLRVKPRRPVDVKERPHSSYIESELKDKREGGFEIQLMSHDKKNALIKTGMTEGSSVQPPSTFGSMVAFRSSSFHQQVIGEIENTRGIKRPAQGSGSFHSSITTSKTRDGERPRSGSFVGDFKKAEAKAIGRPEDKALSSMREKEELRDLQPKAGGFAMGRHRPEGAPHKSPVLPWERKDSSKKTESVTLSKNVITDTSSVAVEEVGSNQEAMEEALEAQEVHEEEGKTFGIKLRPTSQSMRFRSDASSNRHSKATVCEEQGDKQKRQEISDNVTCNSKKLPTNVSSTPSTAGDIQLTDAQTTSSNPKQVETSPEAPREPQPAPQTASPEVSWMTLAMEKTRSLQQLFTSRFPRDFTAVQTAVRPQAQVQTINQTDPQNGSQMQTQAVKIQQSTTPVQTANQASTNTVKAETVQSTTQSVKPSQTAVQQKTSATSTGLSSREQQMSKQVNEPQSAPQAGSHPPVQTNPLTTQSSLRSATQTETSSHFSQGSATQPLAQSCLSSSCQQDTPEQPPWSNRSLHRTNQLKSTTSVSTTSSATAPSPGKGEREANVQEKEGFSVPGRRTVWSGSVSERAAFLEKRAETTNALGTKGVELRKAQTELQAASDTPALTKDVAPSKDTKPDRRDGVKPPESSPVKVPYRPCEEKLLRKNVASPSSSPVQPSALQSMAESGQPSWMELAKRKSMAWSDKTMD
ncbi:cancer-related regulator of actin dynamics isoform X2 [Anabas testudineus]|uniref:cancer-related regulator of actin dynamics isoform X2 n=1 Tax=Anabas testudineus TaxID=64144 RepID=UPI000E45914F|nr:cancer-related regulator of actin dynamics isoform X2 [Anabas testudineus]